MTAEELEAKIVATFCHSSCLCSDKIIKACQSSQVLPHWTVRDAIIAKLSRHSEVISKNAAIYPEVIVVVYLITIHELACERYYERAGQLDEWTEQLLINCISTIIFLQLLNGANE